jgi:release factor glutamine methyltransferase
MSGETVEGWLGRAAGVLAEAGVEEPRMEARLLLAGAAGWPPEAMIARRSHELGRDAADRAETMLERRRRREPASHILGRREFWGLEFAVTADVLDPRADSESLVEAALQGIGNRTAPLHVLDLGTGTGCLLLAILSELPNARGLGVDLSPAAVRVAEMNAERLGLSGRAGFTTGDWGGGLSGGFDLILSNPPYIPSGAIAGLQPEVALWEPRLALDGGPDGLLAYRRLGPEIARLLAPGGRAAIEIGSTQAAEAGAILEQSGLRILECVRDLVGRERCLLVSGDGS